MPRGKSTTKAKTGTKSMMDDDSKKLDELMKRMKKLEEENAKLVSEKAKLASSNHQQASPEQNAIIEGLLAKIKQLEMENADVKAKYNYVGVRNTTKGIVWIKVIGGAPDGSEDIKLNPGEAKPVPALTWEFMVNNNHPNIVSGILIRDDKILGTFGYKADVTDLGEKERFPNSISDDEIRDWYDLKPAEFKKKLSVIDSDIVMQRVVEVGESIEDKNVLKHVKTATARLMEMKNPIPDNFEEMDEDGLLDFAATYNVVIDPHKYDRDVAKLREMIRDAIDARIRQ